MHCWSKTFVEFEGLFIVLHRFLGMRAVFFVDSQMRVRGAEHKSRLGFLGGIALGFFQGRDRGLILLRLVVGIAKFDVDLYAIFLKSQGRLQSLNGWREFALLEGAIGRLEMPL